MPSPSPPLFFNVCIYCNHFFSCLKFRHFLPQISSIGAVPFIAIGIGAVAAVTMVSTLVLDQLNASLLVQSHFFFK